MSKIMKLQSIFVKSKKDIDVIEFKVLYLVQLWADTFMMEESQYKAMMDLYRQLRKEGIQFPSRDVNDKFMIKCSGSSPVHDNIQSIVGNWVHHMDRVRVET